MKLRFFGLLVCALSLSLAPNGHARIPEAAPAPDLLESGLKRDFLLEADWETLLAGVPANRLSSLAEGQSDQFWKTSPIAESAAFRIFAALGRLDAGSAANEAIRIFTQKGQEIGKSCFRWAILGIAESRKEFLTKETFFRCPASFWNELIQGAICGSDAGSLAGDMRSFSALFAQLPALPSANENQSRMDGLKASVVDAWMTRDPAATMAWLMTADGKPHRGALPGAIAAVLFGNPGAALMAKLSASLTPNDFAAACYESGWDAGAVRTLVGRLSEPKRSGFLVAYAEQLIKGSPRTLQSFLDAADFSLLIPEVATVLGPKILPMAPRLFEKLLAQMAPAEQNRFLDDVFKRCVPLTEQGSREASTFYLERRGAAGPRGDQAVRMLATTDLQKAVAFASAAPEAKRNELISNAYADHIDRLAQSEPVDALGSLLLSMPPECSQTAMERLSFAAPDKCFDALLKYYPGDAKMWGAALLGQSGKGSPFLNGDEMNAFLGRAIKSGIDPEVYSIAAKSVALEFARDDIAEACAAVEAVTDLKVQEVCTAAIMSVWSKNDPMQAFVYVSKLASGGRRDSAIAELLPALSFAPQKREELLALISTDAARSSLRSSVPKSKVK